MKSPDAVSSPKRAGGVHGAKHLAADARGPLPLARGVGRESLTLGPAKDAGAGPGGAPRPWFQGARRLFGLVEGEAPHAHCEAMYKRALLFVP